MTATPDSLAPQFREDPNVEPPYSNAQISETAIHREILRIYQSARRETKAVYDLGRDTDRVEEENWVIRWMLWHVFRYRDNRNKNRRAVSPSDGDSASAPSPEGTGMSPTSQPSKFPVCRTFGSAALISVAGASSATTPSRYWDPVRNG
jgi:hypothetical protein